MPPGSPTSTSMPCEPRVRATLVKWSEASPHRPSTAEGPWLAWLLQPAALAYVLDSKILVMALSPDDPRRQMGAAQRIDRDERQGLVQVVAQDL